MTRNKFEEQLSELKDLLTRMGELNCEAIGDAVTALETQNTALARQTKGVEALVDEKEQQIERLCLKIILKQQPVASDLLFVTSAMKMITDMERIADQAVDISELVIKMSKLPYAESVREISDMADKVQEMVRNAAKCFVERDGELAKAVCRSDDDVDDLFDVVKKKLTQIVHKDIDEEDNGEQALDMLMVAKYLEKIGDHASNIAEWVLFMITGDRVRTRGLLPAEGGAAARLYKFITNLLQLLDLYYTTLAYNRGVEVRKSCQGEKLYADRVFIPARVRPDGRARLRPRRRCAARRPGRVFVRFQGAFRQY